jgi:Dullard-like phosphatase family protein
MEVESRLREVYEKVKNGQGQVAFEKFWEDLEGVLNIMASITIPYEQRSQNRKFLVLNIYRQLSLLRMLVVCAWFQFKTGEKSITNVLHNVYQSYVVLIEFAIRNWLKYWNSQNDNNDKDFVVLNNLADQLQSNKVVKSHFSKDRADVFIRRKNEFAMSLIKNMCQNRKIEVNKIILRKIKDVSNEKKVKRGAKDSIKMYEYLKYELKMIEIEKKRIKHNFKLPQHIETKYKLKKSCSQSYIPDENCQINRWDNKVNKVKEKENSNTQNPNFEMKFDLRKINKSFKKNAELLSTRNFRLSPFASNKISMENVNINKIPESTPTQKLSSSSITFKRRRISRKERTESRKRSVVDSKPALSDITNHQSTTKPNLSLLPSQSHSSIIPISPSVTTPTSLPKVSLHPTSQKLEYQLCPFSLHPSTKGYLPPKAPSSPKYTLVLDLDETLIHYLESHEKEALLQQTHKLHSMLDCNKLHRVIDPEDQEEGYFYVRPFVSKFLEQVGEYYEVIIFTAGTKSYADSILELMPWTDRIAHKLYRHHTIKEDEVYVKDLELVGREVRTMIIADNTKENFMYHEDNGVHVRSWYGDDKDIVLQELAHVLKQVAKSQPEDIRTELNKWREVIKQNVE